MPEPPHGLELSLRTHNSVFVTWQRPHDNGLPVEGFRVVVVMEEGEEGDEGNEGNEGKYQLGEGKEQPSEAKEGSKEGSKEGKEEGKEAGKATGREEGKEEGQETAVAATIGGVDKTSSSNSNTCVQFVDLDHTGLPPTSSGIEGRLQVGQV